MKTNDFAALGKRLLSELPEFAGKGQMLFMQPVGHTLKGIFFDRSVNSRRFYVQVFLQPLFVPAEHIGFNVGWRLGGGSHTWDADSPDLIAELSTALKREALPFLSRIQSPRDVAEAATALQKSQDPYVQQAIAYALARAGDVRRAGEALDRLGSLLREAVPWQREMADRARTLKSQLASDPTVAQRQLDTWKIQTLGNLGLEGF